jgi:hypothetical protein
MRAGRFLFAQFPALARLLAPLNPLISLYFSFPFARRALPGRKPLRARAAVLAAFSVMTALCLMDIVSSCPKVGATIYKTGLLCCMRA